MSIYKFGNLSLYCYYDYVEVQWNRLSPRERNEKEAFVAGEKSVIKGFMRMVSICFE